MKRVFELIVGFLFVLSGLIKAFDSASFAQLIVSYSFAWAQHSAPIIAGLEIAIGMGLLLGIFPKITWYFVLVLTFVFTLIFALAWYSKGITDCGCMGNWIVLPPFVSLCRNLFILVVSIWSIKHLPERRENSQRLKIIVWMIVILIGFCLAGSTLGEPLFYKEKIVNTREIDVDKFTAYFNENIPQQGIALYFIFSPNCTHCWNVTENIKSISQQPEFRNLTAICSKEDDDSLFIRDMQPTFPIVKVPAKDLRKFLRQVPILLVYKDGKIYKKFRADHIPPGPVLKKLLNL